MSSGLDRFAIVDYDITIDVECNSNGFEDSGPVLLPVVSDGEIWKLKWLEHPMDGIFNEDHKYPIAVMNV